MAERNQVCEELLKQVYMSGFAMDDVLLYLDPPPDDKEALNYYRYVRELNRRAVEAYEQQCGPLMFDQVESEEYWTWVNGPWPWEGVCG